MTRKRQSGPAWLPERVYLYPYAYVYKPAKSGRTIRLADKDASRAEVMAAFAEALRKESAAGTVAAMMDQFFASADFKALALRTQKDYEKSAGKLLKVFGAMPVNQVEPKHVRRYMDLRGVQSQVQANRDKALFSRAFRWAFERGLADRNPCSGVRQFTERPRDYYITDEEYQAVLAHAEPAVKVAMEISYLCAARQGDVLDLRFSAATAEGLFIRQSKTRKEQIKQWSPRLRAALALAQSSYQPHSPHPEAAVVRNPAGGRYSQRGFISAWHRAQKAARDATGLPLAFTFHDIKAKSISDAPGTSRDKQRFSGHKTEAQIATYDRKVESVPALDDLIEQAKQQEKARGYSGGYSKNIPDEA